MKSKNIWINVLTLLQVMLLFMAVFEERLILPSFIQIIGRSHPLILHFPIVLIFISTFFLITSKRWNIPKDIVEIMLFVGAFSATITAISGLFLSRETGYSPDELLYHKWGGVIVSVLMSVWLMVREAKNMKWIVTFLSVIAVIITGHLGAGITHGEGFLLEPIMEKEVKISGTSVFSEIIQPIANEKCTNCHNAKKRKGELDLTNFNGWKKGGEQGSILLNEENKSELIRRIFLASDHDDAMPPKGKRSLTEEELAVINLWVASGGDTLLSVAELLANDSTSALIQPFLLNDQPSDFTFDAASSEVIKKLNNPYRTVRPLFPESAGLEASIYVGSQFSSSSLKELLEVKEQLVSLNLSNLPISNDDLTSVGQMKSLRKLWMNNGQFNDEGLNALSQLDQLQLLSLSGNKIKSGIEPILNSLPNLEKVFIWNTLISADDLASLAKKFPNVQIEYGFEELQGEELTLSAPQNDQSGSVLTADATISLSHQLPGVKVYYRTDGEFQTYINPLPIGNIHTIFAFAEKDGWINSDTVEYSFFIQGFKPISIKPNLALDEQYKGQGAKTLIDNKKGTVNNFSGGEWLGFRDHSMDMTVDFGKNFPTISEVVLGYGLNMPSYIMKPVEVKILGSSDGNKWDELGGVKVPNPTGFSPNGEFSLAVKISVPHRYYRVIAVPMPKLPKWHNGAGDRGWIFVDELFFY